MRLSGTRIWLGLVTLALVAAIPIAYRAGYQAGLHAKGPQHRALAVVRRNANDPNSLGTSYTWFDISNPEEAERLRQQEAQLKAIKAEYYIAKGHLESTIRAEPDPQHANSHR